MRNLTSSAVTSLWFFSSQARNVWFISSSMLKKCLIVLIFNISHHYKYYSRQELWMEADAIQVCLFTVNLRQQKAYETWKSQHEYMNMVHNRKTTTKECQCVLWHTTHRVTLNTHANWTTVWYRCSLWFVMGGAVSMWCERAFGWCSLAAQRCYFDRSSPPTWSSQSAKCSHRGILDNQTANLSILN